MKAPDDRGRPWTKRTAPRSDRVEQAPHERHCGHFLNWDRCSAFVRVPIPKHLRARFKREGQKSNSVRWYLETGDKTKARELAPAALAAIRAEFKVDDLAPVVGHAGGKRGFTLDVYNPEDPLLVQRAAVVMKLDYKGVNPASPARAVR